MSTTAPVPRPSSADVTERLVEERDGLVAYFANRVPDRQTAEDLAHDVLVNALAKLDEIDPERPLWPWLMVIAKNRLTDHYRRVSVARDYEDHPRLGETLTPTAVQPRTSDFDDPGTRMGEQEMLTLAMRPLTGRQRSALMLHDVHGWTSEQIAQLHDRNRNAVHQVLYRARNHVRGEYERLSGDKRSLGLLPWPLLWAAEVARRAATRARRTVQEWHLALPAVGESMASVAVAATLSLGAGAIWGLGPVEASDDDPQVPDLSDVDLAASAEAAAPRLGQAEDDSAVDGGGLDQQRLANAIADAEPDAFEAERTAREEAEAKEDSVEIDTDSGQPSLDDPTDPVESTDATIDPSVETSDSKHLEDGIRIEPKTNAKARAGDVEVEDNGERSIEVTCVDFAGENTCDDPELSTEESASGSSEEIMSESEQTGSDVLSDSEEYVEEREGDTENAELLVDHVSDDDCDSEDVVATACETAQSID